MNSHRRITSAWALMVMLALPLSPVNGAPRSEQRVAVVELEDNARLGSGVANALTDSVRGEVAELLGKRFTMITQENIYELVDEQTCNDASGASCEVEMGKLLGAHYIISGSLTKLGGKLNLALRVHETKTSKLLGVREESASDVSRLKVRVLPRLARGASALIDPEVASRTDTLNAELEVLKREVGVKASDEGGDDLAAQLKRLEEAELEKKELVGEGSDDEYQRELKRIADTVAERKMHEKEVASAWTNVQEIARQDTTKGILAIRLFIDHYGGHKLGNPKASEAQNLLSKLQNVLVREKHEMLKKAHLRAVRADLEKVRPIISVGDKKAKKALDLFLNAYDDHPMGNPLADEARDAFHRAEQIRNNRLKSEHEQNVKRDWLRVQDTVRKGGLLGRKALELFLNKYHNHPFGNPYASQAVSTYQKANETIEAEQEKLHHTRLKQEWSYILDSVKRNPRSVQENIRLIDLFVAKYSRHPLGNNLEPEAKQLLFALKLGATPSGNEESIKAWALSQSVSAQKGKYLNKALFAFLTSIGFTVMTAYGGYLYKPTLQALRDQGYMEVFTSTDENGIESEEIIEIGTNPWVAPLFITNIFNVIWIGLGELAWTGKKPDMVVGEVGAMIMMSLLTTAVGTLFATGTTTTIVKDDIRSSPPSPSVGINSLIWLGALGSVVSIGFTQYYLTMRKNIKEQDDGKVSTFYFTPIKDGAMAGLSWEW